MSQERRKTFSSSGMDFGVASDKGVAITVVMCRKKWTEKVVVGRCGGR